MAGEREFVDRNVKRALLREFLKNEIKRAGYGGADIQRTPMGTRVTLITERPGLVIGRKGSSIKALTDAIEFDFNFDKPQVEVVEVDNPNLSAQIMAEKLASALERGWHFRRAGHSTVRRIMENGAKGCQVIISGKLTGQRHRTEKFKEGHIKFCGEPKFQWMEEGYTPAKLKAGVIGVKVQIMHPDARLPDEVNIIGEKEAAKIPDAEPTEPEKEEVPDREPVAEKPAKEEPERTESMPDKVVEDKVPKKDGDKAKAPVKKDETETKPEPKKAGAAKKPVEKKEESSPDKAEDEQKIEEKPSEGEPKPEADKKTEES